MIEEISFEKYIEFPRELTYSEIESYFDYMKKKLGDAGAENYKDSDGSPAGFFAGNYPEGFAYLFMNFIRHSNIKGRYCSALLKAEAPGKKRRELTEKLAEDVIFSLGEFFKK